jgi:hypothetical protein
MRKPRDSGEGLGYRREPAQVPEQYVHLWQGVFERVLVPRRPYYAKHLPLVVDQLDCRPNLRVP